MELAFRYVAPLSRCGYLPDQVWRLEYEQPRTLTPAEYEERLRQGWRRFGYLLFRPRCPACSACRSLRVLAASFQPNRSQRRVRKQNEHEVRLIVGPPTVTEAKLDLYDRFHAYQTATKGWPPQGPKDADEYAISFVHNPFPTEEWCYYLDGRLVGVGYVDQLPHSLSAIYFFHDPGQRRRSLGTWNILSLIAWTAAKRRPFLYLGYYVNGCRSMAYKNRYVPNQILGPKGEWLDRLT